jgi:hypothetical protein
MVKRAFCQLAALMAVVGVAARLHAKVGSVEFAALVKASDVVVLGNVVDVSTVDGVKVARVKVIETYKGTKVDQLFFLAQPTWICDISEAMKGETALLFLTAYEDRWKGSELILLKPLPTREALQRAGVGQAMFQIVDSGRGRMPLRSVGGEKYATVWVGDVRLPVSVRTISGPKPDRSFIRSAALSDIVGLVQSQVALAQLFQHAPEKAANADCFRSLTQKSSVYDAVTKCGRPDEETGSGVYIFIYHLRDGSTVSIGTPYLERIDRITLKDASGKRTSLLAQ